MRQGLVGVFLLLFAVLLVVGAPIAIAMLAASLAFTGLTQPGSMIAVPHRMFNGIDSFVLIAIPFFLLVGQLMTQGQLIERLLDLVRFLLGRMSGGLAQVNIGTSMLFAGISGTATADSAAIGSVLIPAMVRERYSRAFSAAVTAASSTIGPVIPPSVIMVALGALVGASVGRLFLGGVVPGVLAGLLMLAISYVISKRHGYGKIPVAWTLRAFAAALGRAAGPLMIPVILVGGIVGGVFTPTEASNIAVVVALVLGFVVYRVFTLQGVWEAVRGTLYLLGPVMLIISAASVMGSILIQEHVGTFLASTLSTVSQDPRVILLLIAVAVLILGCFIEALAIMFLIAPVLMPVITLIGIDPIHFGVVLVLAMMIGLITPPVGVSMFIACGIARCSVDEFMRAVTPFFVVLVVNLLFCIFFPELVLWLPNLMMPTGS